MSAKAQRDSQFHIGLESGGFALEGKIDDRWDFRQPTDYQPAYRYYHGSEKAYGEGTLFYVGIKPQLALWNDRITLASGVRYIHVQERITSGSKTYPLFLYSTSREGIDLFRVNGIDESLGYLTIPMEVNLAVIGNRHVWHIYVKGGVQAGMKIHGKTEIDFVSDKLDKYNDEVLAGIGKAPASFFSDVYTSIGVRFILRNAMRLSLDFPAFHSILSKGNFSLLNSQTFPGMQVTISTPVNFFSTK
ncbi:hypothetical protein D7D25_08540 [Proteiniphilum sp. X52]|nr:hypothetical protein D7D25_08540 [Proteiniphilum sp. X52]